jgi:gliding motility-associated-like protein
VGTNYTLTVNATNAQTYQWYKNNVAIAGETTKTYSKSVSASDAGTYKVVITNGCGYSINSNNAILTVNTLPTITSSPANTTVCVGQPISASVSATANSGGNLRYIWTSGGSEIPGATSSNFTISKASSNENGKVYTVSVLNDCNIPVNGGSFTVTVGDKPKDVKITTSIPNNTVTGNPTVCVGSPITFSVESVSNGYNPSYTWYKDDVSKGTSSNSALSISSSATTDAGIYKLTASNTCGATTSNSITIGVHEKPIIANQPESSITACELTTVTLSGLAQNKPGTNSAITYTWYYNNNPFTLNAPNLILTNIKTDETGNYQLRASNECGAVSSNTSVLTVVSKPKYSIITPSSDLAICSATYQTKTISVNIFAINGATPSIVWSTSDGSITGYNTVGNTANVTVASVGKDATYNAELSNSCGTTVLQNFGVDGIKIKNESATPSVTTFTAHPLTTFCERNQIKLNVTTKSSAAETYTWKLNNVVVITQSGNTNSSDYTKANSTTADQGTYTVDITNKCGTLSNAVSIPVTVNPTPVVAFDVANPVTQCLSNNLFNFTNRTEVANGSTIDYVWQFGDGSINTTDINATTHSYANSGSYTVGLTGTNNYGCKNSTTKAVIVAAEPRITKQPVGGVVCQGNSNLLSAEINSGGATSLTYQWYFNNQPISNNHSNPLTLQISSMSASNAGTYYLKIINAQCNLSNESARATVSFQEKPNPSFTAGGKSLTSCINDAEFTFINTTPAVANVSYLWNVSDGSTSRENNFTYKFASTGIYEVSLTATAGGCSSEAVYILGNRNNQIRVNTIPTITTDLVSDLTIKKGEAINLSVDASHSYVDGTNPAPPITYQWYKLPSSTVIFNDKSFNRITSAVISDTGRYYVNVRNACGFVRSNTIKIKVIDKPSITIQPIATKVCLDKALQLTVDAISNDNSSPLYQWFYQQDLNAQPVPIANATGAEFNIAKFKISDEGHYYATLTNSVGTTTSDKVIVTANDVPIINSIESIPSIESGICINTALQLNATVSNIANSTNTISWEQNGVTLPGQSNLQINFAAIAKTNNGDLILKVANACGTASKTVKIKVIDLPQFTQSPIAVTTCLNGAANFTAKVQSVTDGTPYGFQWLKNGNTYNGTGIISDEKLSLSNVQVADAGFYALQATNACGVTTSATAKLTVLTAGPTITQQPTEISACVGAQKSASIIANSEDNILTYSWYKNGILIANEINSQLLFNAIATSDAGTYKGVVTNGCGLTTTSNNFIIVVKEKVSLNGTIANKELCVGNNLTSDISGFLNSADINTTYQWRLNDIDLTEASAKTNSLSLLGITKVKEGKYSVITNNSCGTSTLNLFSLKVNAAPEITTQPIPGLVCEGGSFTNNIIANNNSQLPLSYQWLKDGTVITNNGTAQQLQLQNISGVDQGLYAVRVSNTCGTTLSTSARLSLIGNPIITQQPAAINSCSGLENTATIVATSDDNRLTYKWFKNGSLIAGQIGSQLNFPNITATDAGSYKAIVTNGCNLSTTSSDFLVFVKEKIALNGSITNKQLCVGNTLDVDLSAYLTGTDVSSRYQWRLNSIDITEASAKTNRIQLLNVAKTNQGAYSLIATNGCGPSTLNLFNLTINTAPEITTQPVAGFVCEGKTFTNSVFVANATQLPLSYQWFKDGNSITNNATAQQLVLQNIAAADQGLYAVRVSNTCGTTLSSSARLSLIGNPVITQQPASITSCAGIENIATIVGSSDDNTLVYKWYKDGILLADQISNQLIFSKILSTDIGAYKSVITNSCGLSTTSNIFQVVVNDKIKIIEAISNKTVCVGSDFETDLASNLKGADLSSKYQWKLNGIDILSNSAKTNKIQLLNVTKANSGKYSILATNNCGAAIIDLFNLGITNLPAIETHPIEGSVCENLDWSNKVVTSNADQIGFTYQWYKDGVALSGATQPTIYVSNLNSSNKGLYSVKLSSACGDVISQSALLQVRPTPQIDIALVGTPPMQCIDNNLFTFKSNIFISDNSMVDLTWDFGNGVTSKQSQVSHSYGFANDFNVYLFAKSIYGCKDTAVQVVSVNTKPVITENIVNQILCTGAQLNYNVDVKVKPNEKVGYQWYFNQDPILNAVNKSISIDNVQKVNGGNYKLRITNACGITYSTEAELKIAEKPIVTVPLPINYKVCDGFETVLQPTVFSLLPKTFQWYKNELPYVGRESDTLRIKQFGTQDVATYAVSITNKCGTTYSIPGNLIMKNIAWSTQSLVSDTICYQTDTKLALKDFANNDDTLIFSWFKDGLPLTGVNTKDFSINKFIINDTGYYAAKLTNSCGILNVPVAKLTLNKVNAAFSLDTLDACKGSLIINGLDTTRSLFRIRDNYWQIKELSRTLGSTPGMRFQFSNSGTYTIRHAVTDIKGCNSDTVSKIVINYGKPTASFTINDTCMTTPSIALNNSVFGHASSKLTKYTWNFGDTTIIRNTSIVPSYTYKTAGPKSLQLIVESDSSCVADTMTKKLMVYGNPVASFVTQDSCQGFPVLFTNRSFTQFTPDSVGRFSWNFDDGATSSLRNPQNIFKEYGAYKIKLTAFSANCPFLTDDTTINMTIKSPRANQVYPRIQTVKRVVGQMNAIGNGRSYAWLPYTGLTDTKIKNPKFSITEDKITYTITIVDSAGCVNNDKQEVWAFTKPDIYLATGFSPNNDGVNDKYKPEYIEIKILEYFRVQDSNNRQVFITNSLTDKWDGTYNGNPLPPAPYLVSVAGIDIQGNRIVKQGIVIVVK